MENGELRGLLGAHAAVLGEGGFDVQRCEVGPPATEPQVDEVEAAFGLTVPESFRAALTTLAGSVDWYWLADRRLPAPYDEIFSGLLRWSIDTLVETQRGYEQWVVDAFPDPDDPYHAVWHGKLAFCPVPNGDHLAVDLDPARAGAVVYLSHDDGQGHGYVLADSLDGLVERWVPLACPGAEDWQWLPFVPWDEGPIDPTCANARRWIELLGLRDDPPRTPPVAPTPDHVDDLLARFRRSPTSNEGRRAGRRALKCCTTDRVGDVLELLGADDSAIQETAAKLLGDSAWPAAVPALVGTVRNGRHNGRLAALRALRRIPGPEAAAAITALRAELGESWDPYFR